MHSPGQPHALGASFLRFLVAGGANTLITGTLLSLLSHFIDPRLAYAITFAIGILLAIWLAGRFVFGVRLSARRAAAYGALYLAVFAVGLLLVTLGERAGLPHEASGLVVVFTAPLTFVGGRVLLVVLPRQSTRESHVE